MMLESIKEMIRQIEVKRKPDALFSPGLYESVPRGELIEVSGPGRREWIARFLISNPDLETAWMEDAMEVLPTALRLRNVDLDRISFAENDEDLDELTLQILKSGFFQVLVVPQRWVAWLKEKKKFRQFLALAKRQNIVLFLLSEYPENGFPMTMRIHARYKEEKIVSHTLKSFIPIVLKPAFSSAF